MRLICKSSFSPIGLDIGAASIKLVQLRRGRGDQWAVGRAICLARTSTGSAISPSEATQLADVLERQGFVGRSVVVAAPAEALMVDVLDLPPRDSGAPVEALAMEEVSRSHKVSAEEFCLAVWDLPAGQRGSAGASAMSVSLKHQDANTLIDSLESGGLYVAAIDTSASALVRACTKPANPGTIRAILDIGFNAATLMLVVDGSVIYQRRLAEAGLVRLEATIDRELRLGPAESRILLGELGVASGTGFGPAASRARGIILRHIESLNDEIEGGLQYARHRHPGMQFGELLLAGGGAAINGIEALLGSRLSVSACALRPTETQTDGHSSASAIFAQAYGLAMHGAA